MAFEDDAQITPPAQPFLSPAGLAWPHNNDLLRPGASVVLSGLRPTLREKDTTGIFVSALPDANKILSVRVS